MTRLVLSDSSGLKGPNGLIFIGYQPAQNAIVLHHLAPNGETEQITCPEASAIQTVKQELRRWFRVESRETIFLKDF